jgi:hypothetical protein
LGPGNIREDAGGGVHNIQKLSDECQNHLSLCPVYDV